MPFPRQLLSDGEEVVSEFRPNWTYLGWPLVASVGVVVLTIGVVLGFPKAPRAVIYVLLALIVVALSWLAARALRRSTTSIVVTTSRVMRRMGVLSRSNLEIRLERINELSYHQSIGGRILREGEVWIELGGESGVVVLNHIPRPAVVQSLISGQVSDWHRRQRSSSFGAPLQSPGTPLPGTPLPGTPLPGTPLADTPPTGSPVLGGWQGPPQGVSSGWQGPPQGGSSPSAAERLVQLDELRRRGIVTEDEFEAKRAQLLREL